MKEPRNLGELGTGLYVGKNEIWKDIDRDIKRIRSEYEFQIYMNQDEPAKNDGIRYMQEKALFYYVSVGDLKKMETLIENMEIDHSFYPNKENEKIGDMSDNLQQKAQFILVANVTLSTRAAMDGGLPDFIAYAISDSFIRCISRVNDESRITSLNFDVLREFTRAVHHYRYRNCSQMTSVCCEYILRHLHDRISLQDLSGVCHRSPNHISALFMKELGMRPLLFIRERKLEYAEYILKTTELPVAAISNLLAFPSTSSFIGYFKESYNMTPQQYRSIHR